MNKYLSQKAIDYLLSLNNVVGIGYGLKEVKGKLTDQKAIVVMVSRKVTQTELIRRHVVLKSIEGFVTDVIEVGKVSAHRIQEEGPIGEAEDNVSRKSSWRPAPGGVSIGHYKITAGTLGVVVYDNFTGKKLILSNNHVLANSTNGKDKRAKKGDPILQPGPLDGGTKRNDKIAKLYRYVPLKDNGFNVVDAAVAKPLRQGLVVPEILGIGTVQGKTLPQLGMLVKKSGRTTGLTSGIVQVIDAIIDVDYDGRILKFKNQIMVTAFDQGGDSGSLVLNEFNWAVGLLFAGSDTFTFVNPIDPVLDLLGVHL
ncbi:MAG: S1 family peptidase [Dehalobacter sp.]|nr:S1 family peptidase [Dehalobacter sp.]